MGQTIKTKYDYEQKLYFMASNAIASGTVTEIKPDVTSTIVITNTLTLPDGSTKTLLDTDTGIYTSPEDLTADLLNAWYTANPKPEPTAQQQQTS